MLAFVARLQDSSGDDIAVILPPGKNEWLADPVASVDDEHTGKISRMSRNLLKRSVPHSVAGIGQAGCRRDSSGSLSALTSNIESQLTHYS
jgi:hypothetical protein